jgi:DNA topoisomerase-1
VHPVSEKKIQLKAGRYGPYVTDGEINASLARDADPNTLTLEDAVNLLSARAAKVAEGGGPRRKRGAKPKQVAAPKTPKKKATKKSKAKAKPEPESE